MSSKKFGKGDEVEVWSNNKSDWIPGRISKVFKSGRYEVVITTAAGKAKKLKVGQHRVREIESESEGSLDGPEDVSEVKVDDEETRKDMQFDPSDAPTTRQIKPLPPKLTRYNDDGELEDVTEPIDEIGGPGIYVVDGKRLVVRARESLKEKSNPVVANIERDEHVEVLERRGRRVRIKGDFRSSDATTGWTSLYNKSGTLLLIKISDPLATGDRVKVIEDIDYDDQEEIVVAGTTGVIQSIDDGDAMVKWDKDNEELIVNILDGYLKKIDVPDHKPAPALAGWAKGINFKNFMSLANKSLALPAPAGGGSAGSQAKSKQPSPQEKSAPGAADSLEESGPDAARDATPEPQAEIEVTSPRHPKRAPASYEFADKISGQDVLFWFRGDRIVMTEDVNTDQQMIWDFRTKPKLKVGMEATVMAGPLQANTTTDKHASPFWLKVRFDKDKGGDPIYQGNRPNNGGANLYMGDYDNGWKTRNSAGPMTGIWFEDFNKIRRIRCAKNQKWTKELQEEHWNLIGGYQYDEEALGNEIKQRRAEEAAKKERGVDLKAAKKRDEKDLKAKKEQKRKADEELLQRKKREEEEQNRREEEEQKRKMNEAFDKFQSQLNRAINIFRALKPGEEIAAITEPAEPVQVTIGEPESEIYIQNSLNFEEGCTVIAQGEVIQCDSCGQEVRETLRGTVKKKQNTRSCRLTVGWDPVGWVTSGVSSLATGAKNLGNKACEKFTEKTGIKVNLDTMVAVGMKGIDVLGTAALGPVYTVGRKVVTVGYNAYNSATRCVDDIEKDLEQKRLEYEEEVERLNEELAKHKEYNCKGDGAACEMPLSGRAKKAAIGVVKDVGKEYAKSSIAKEHMKRVKTAVT